MVTPATRAQTSAKRTKANSSAGTSPCGRPSAKCPKTPWGVVMDKLEQVKARIRAKGEHAFHVIKNLFHHRKTRYRGLEKNTKQLYTLFGLANLVLARRWLLAPQGQSAS